MKKIIFAFIAMTTMAVEAQNITDAVRYSTSDLNGTARYRALSGAFGALGGDLSSLNTNPAGAAVFLRSFSSFSLDVVNSENQVNYYNGFSTNSDSNVGMGQAGAVFVFNNRSENNDWRKFTLGFNYSRTQNFDNDFLATATNAPNSIDRYFLGYADGLPLDLLVPREDETVSSLYTYLGENEGYGAQQAMLGYQGFIINADDPDDFENNRTYYSAVGQGAFDQEYSYAATGLNGKFTFNFATQFQDHLYLGLNLNSHFLNYDRITIMDELNSNPGSEVSSIYFEDRLSTLGSGFSFQLGGLAKVGDRVRLGLSYESPTWYSISEETTQYLETDRATVNPNTVNVYPDYTLQTPANYTGSIAVLFGGQGLLSFDYSYKDFSTARFKPTGEPDFSIQNTIMEQDLQAAATYRLGGEYRIAAWSLRGGYRYEESPYTNSSTIGDLNGYSLGFGYNFGSAKIDFAYDTFEQERNPQLFQVGLTDTAFINRDRSSYTLTLSFGI